jgi:hypothetical protein
MVATIAIVPKADETDENLDETDETIIASSEPRPMIVPVEETESLAKQYRSFLGHEISEDESEDEDSEIDSDDEDVDDLLSDSY